MDRYAVIGNPVEHSKSPLLHKLFAEQTGQNMVYDKILASLDGFATAVTTFRQAGGKGFNITVPFKLEAYHYVDELSDAAKAAQAVNTIMFRKDGSSYGHNTDGIGLIRDLHNKKVTLKNRHILILGAGGATRGCLLPLLQQQPASITICNRDVNKAKNLATDFAAYKNVFACHYENLIIGKQNYPSGTTPIAHEFNVIINATSASIHSELPPIPDAILRETLCCYDMAYGLDPTLFEKWARARSVQQIYNGIGMLVEQGAESFYLWRGVRPDTIGIAEKLLALQ